MTIITIQIPAITIETIQQWADKSRLNRARFYTTALEMGMNTLESSLGFLGDLTPEAIEEAARELGEDEMMAEDSEVHESLGEETLAQMRRAADQSITPALLAQIILGEQAKQQDSEMELVTVEYPDERALAVEALADKSGIGSEKLYAMAFATGARLMSYTLSPFSFFSPEAMARAMERPRNRQNKSKDTD